MTAQTEAAETKTGELGKARLRKEDERLITGQTNWTANITLPGMLHIAFLRSPYAHARITSVDVSAARNEPMSWKTRPRLYQVSASAGSSRRASARSASARAWRPCRW